MMRSARFLILAITALFAASVSSAPVAVPACGPYQLAYYELGSLYYRKTDGNYAGIDKDIVEELARRSGCTFKVSLDSRARIWSQLSDGSLDMSTSGIITPDREKQFTFVPYIVSRNYLLISHELAKRIHSLKAFSADPTLRLAVVKSFKHGQTLDIWVDQLRAQKRVDEYADVGTVARVFAVGRADAFLSEPIVWGPLLEKAGLTDKVRKIDVVPGENFIAGLVLTKNTVRPEDADRMHKAMRSLVNDGTAERIFAQYLSVETAREVAYRAGP